MPTRGKLKPQDEAVIKQNFIYLKEEIDARHIVDHLYSKDVISLDDKEEIVSQSTRSKRNDVLLDKLMHAGPGKAYGEFLKILEADYCHVAQRLKGTKLAPHKKDADWHEQLSPAFKAQLITDNVANKLSECFGNNWESVMLELGHNQATIEREKMMCNNNIVRAITSLFIKWRQKQPQTATYGRLIDCLNKVQEGGTVTIEFNDIEKIFATEDRLLANENQHEQPPRMESGSTD